MENLPNSQFSEAHKHIKVLVLSRITSIIDVSNALEDAHRFAQSKGWKNTSLDFTKVQAMISVLTEAVYEIHKYVEDLDRSMLLSDKIARVTTNVLYRSTDLRAAINDYAHGKITKEILDNHFQDFMNA